MAEGKSGFSVVFRTTLFLVGIALIAMILQVVMNKPEDRPKVLCLPPYKAVFFFGVSVPSVLIPREHLFAVKASRVATGFYHSCVAGTSKLFSITSSSTSSTDKTTTTTSSNTTEPGAQK